MRVVRIRYRTKNHLQEEKEELTIAGEIDTAKDIHDLGILLRDGKVKEFYAIANKLMMIKRNNPVVSKVKRDTPDGDVEILEDRALSNWRLLNTSQASTRDQSTWHLYRTTLTMTWKKIR